MIIKTSMKCYVTQDTTHYNFNIIDEKIGMPGYRIQYEDSNTTFVCCNRPNVAECQQILEAIFLDIKEGKTEFEFN